MESTCELFFPASTTYRHRHEWCLSRGIIRWDSPADAPACRSRFV